MSFTLFSPQEVSIIIILLCCGERERERETMASTSPVGYGYTGFSFSSALDCPSSPSLCYGSSRPSPPSPTRLFLAISKPLSSSAAHLPCHVSTSHQHASCAEDAPDSGLDADPPEPSILDPACSVAMASTEATCAAASAEAWKSMAASEGSPIDGMRVAEPRDKAGLSGAPDPTPESSSKPQGPSLRRTPLAMTAMNTMRSLVQGLVRTLSPREKGDIRDIILMSLSFAVYVYISQKLVCAYCLWQAMGRNTF